MKKTLISFALVLGFAGTVYATAGIPITVPSAPGANYVLLSLPTGKYNYVATSSLGISGGGASLSGGSPNTLTYWTGTGTISATSSPTVGYITATSTTATSTLPSLSSTNFFTSTLNLGASAISYIRGLFVQGTGISISGGTITNTAPDQTVSLSNGTAISVTGTYPNFTITNTSPSSGGTVTSVTGTYPVSVTVGAAPVVSLLNMATGTVTCAGTASCGAGSYVIGSNLTITGSGGTGSISTSSALSSGQILYATGVNTVASVATSTLTPSAPLGGSFTQLGSGGSITCATCNTSNASVSSVASTWPITGGTITTTGTLGFGGLSTSSAAVLGNVPYFTGVNTFGNTATTSVTCSGSTSCTGFTVFGSSPITISSTGGAGSAAGTWSTTTSQTAGQLVNYSNNTTDIVSVGANSTTTAKFYVDPNLGQAVLNGGGAGTSTLSIGSSTHGGCTQVWDAVNATYNKTWMVGGILYADTGTCTP